MYTVLQIEGELVCVYCISDKEGELVCVYCITDREGELVCVYCITDRERELVCVYCISVPWWRYEVVLSLQQQQAVLADPAHLHQLPPATAAATAVLLHLDDAALALPPPAPLAQAHLGDTRHVRAQG